MDSTKADAIIGDEGMQESGSITHEGRTFTAGGAMVSESLIIGYPHAPGEGYLVLRTWEGAPIFPIYRTGTSTGFYGSTIEHFASVGPYLGRFWHGKGSGLGMFLRMRPGRAAKPANKWNEALEGLAGAIVALKR